MYTGRYWKRIINSKEKQGPFEFPIEANSSVEAINKAKEFIRCNLETITASVIENPQLLVEGCWIPLD